MNHNVFVFVVTNEQSNKDICKYAMQGTSYRRSIPWKLWMHLSNMVKKTTYNTVPLLGVCSTGLFSEWGELRFTG